jgi:hypothetical protein
VSGRTLIVASLAAALALVGTSLALGGADYRPRPVADPCQPRQWRSVGSLDDLAQQLTSSALDGAACELHTSRETVVLALATPAGRRRFADDPRLGAALRAGLVRAIDDADRAGAIPGLIAAPLRELVERLPADQLVAAARDAGSLLSQAGGLLGPLGGVLGGL